MLAILAVAYVILVLGHSDQITPVFRIKLGFLIVPMY